MLKRLTLMSAAAAILLFVRALHGQSATEIYIPVGKSPGMSGIATIVGSIEDFDNQQKLLTISDASGNYRVALTDDTRIWLDNSQLKKQNETGSAADCKPGLKAEVKYTENQLKESVTADWIKIQVTN